MNRRSLGLLVVINVFLMIGLLVVSLGARPAIAQLGGRGDYAIISGEAIGSPDLAVVYVLELRNQMLAAITFDTRTKKLDVIDTRPIEGDLESGGKR